MRRLCQRGPPVSRFVPGGPALSTGWREMQTSQAMIAAASTTLPEGKQSFVAGRQSCITSFNILIYTGAVRKLSRYRFSAILACGRLCGRRSTPPLPGVRPCGVSREMSESRFQSGRFSKQANDPFRSPNGFEPSRIFEAETRMADGEKWALGHSWQCEPFPH